MTNRSKRPSAGMPVTVTTIVSLSDPVVMVTCPDALGKHAAMPAAGTSLNEKDEVTWGVVEPAAVVTPAAATTATASAAAPVASLPGANTGRRRVREWDFGSCRFLLSMGGGPGGALERGRHGGPRHREGWPGVALRRFGGPGQRRPGHLQLLPR